MLSDENWNISRKRFVQTMLLGGAALQLPWLTSCTVDNGYSGPTDPLSLEQFKRLQQVLGVLFPNDGNGPGALEIHADTYLLWVLNDTELDPDENRYIIEKLDKLEAYSKKHTGDSFVDLSMDEQFNLLDELTEIKWGNRWISRLLTLIFEALLLDPQYGANPDGIGWKWLQHDPGTPRPAKNLLYPEILNYSHEV